MSFDFPSMTFLHLFDFFDFYLKFDQICLFVLICWIFLQNIFLPNFSFFFFSPKTFFDIIFLYFFSKPFLTYLLKALLDKLGLLQQPPFALRQTLQVKPPGVFGAQSLGVTEWDQERCQDVRLPLLQPRLLLLGLALLQRRREGAQVLVSRCKVLLF